MCIHMRLYVYIYKKNNSEMPNMLVWVFQVHQISHGKSVPSSYTTT